MYAVVRTGGKQYKVEPGTVFDVELLTAEVGEGIEFSEVLLVADGEQVTIPTIEQAQDGEQTNTSSSKTGSSTKKEAKININTAGAEELQELSGVGPALSERIIAYREANGRFARIEDLQNVSGIGETRFANLKDKICV